MTTSRGLPVVDGRQPGDVSTQLQRFLHVLWQPDDVREVRIPRHNQYGHTASGYFDSPDELAAAAAGWDGRANLYVSLNPVSPALLARANNRIAARAEATTADDDVTRRRSLLLDIDPVRPSGISSTDSELEAAHVVLDSVTGFLSDEGWPDPMTALSGNGYYAIYAINLPNDQASLELAKRVLSGLAARFDTDRVHVDTAVANAARLVGLIGTLKVKGDSTPDRPHRRSRLESVPEKPLPVSQEQLESVAALAPKPGSTLGKLPIDVAAAAVRLDEIMRQHGIEYREQAPDANGFTWYHVRQCPFHADGRQFECGVGQKLPDGPFAGKCFHPEGEGKGWQEWKAALGVDLGHPVHDALPAAGDGRPRIIVVNRHLRDIVDDAWKALLARNDPPVLFQHGREIAEVIRDSEDLPGISHLGLAGLRGRLDRCADWMRHSDEGPGGLRPARPPRDVVEDMLALPRPLPVLRGIVGVPTFTPDGNLPAAAGYQAATGLYYEPIGDMIPSVSLRPDATDLKRAKQIIGQEWLSDFPFRDEASRANAVAVPLTVVVREMIDGPTPLFAIDAPAPGTGKTLLAEGIGIVVSGVRPAVTTDTRSEEELRKRITAILRSGNSVVLFDNVKRRQDSAILGALLTATTWSDRMLGKNETVQLPNRTVWIATGNNLELDNEIARRSVWIRLDAAVDRPWQRTAFRHGDLSAWLRRHRHELVWAILVLAQNWVAQGRPPWTGRVLGSYESWSSIIGGMLESAGIGGFLANREELYERTDSETEEWRAFTRRWWEQHQDHRVKVGELMNFAVELLPGLFEGLKDGASERAFKTRLGKALAHRRDRRYGDLFIRWAGEDGHSKSALWRLEAAKDADVESADSTTSAEHPHHNGSTSDSNAGHAGHAGLVSGVGTENGGIQCEGEKREAIAKRHPQHPQVPQTDSILPSGSADVVRKMEQGSADVPPWCPGCGLIMSESCSLAAQGEGRSNLYSFSISRPGGSTACASAK